MDNEIRFLYSVYPKKPIKNLMPNGRPINSPKSLQLTKEEVRRCMQCGTVYRRFADGATERITTLNIDRLHNKEFISEADWKNMNTAEEVKVEEPSKPEPIKEPEKVEEPKVEEPVEESVETKEEVVEETESKTEESTEDEEVIDDVELLDEAKAEDEIETDDRGAVINTEAEASDQIVPAGVSSNEYYNNNYNHRKKKKH